MRCTLPDCNNLVATTEPFAACRPCCIKITQYYRLLPEVLTYMETERMKWVEADRAKIRAGETSTAVVYYVRLDEERIKIGFTSQIKERMAGLRVPRTNLLATEPGGRALETERHQQFRLDRVNAREEFNPSPALITHINNLRAIHGLPRWATLPDTTVITRRVK